MKIDPYYQRQNCGTMTLVSGGIGFMRIFAEVPQGGASNDSGVVEHGNFQSLHDCFLETLEIRPALLHIDMQFVVGFSVIPKCMTLNDLQWLFRIKFCFRAGLAGSARATLEEQLREK